MIRALSPAMVLFGVVVACSAAHANPLITTQDRQSAECLDRIHKRMRKLALIQLDEHSRCHRLRMQGTLPPGDDCNDPASVVDPGRIDYWANRLAENSRVCNASVPPVDQGFISCQAPCDAIGVADYTGVASCMACLTTLETSQAASTVFGTPPAPAPRGLVTCQRRVLQAFARYFLERIESQKKCRLLQKYLRVDAAVDCRDADLQGRSARALERLRAIVTKCSAAALTALDSCADNIAAEQTCLQDAAELHTKALYDFIHP